MVLFSGYLVFPAALASLASGGVYIYAMLKGSAKPNRITWLMWTVAPLIASAAEISSNVGLAAIPVFINGFTPLLIFLSSFAVKNGYWKVRKSDYAFGLLSAAALLLWYITKTPDIAILFSIAADGLAGMPTIIKAWRNPETESVWIYASGTFSAVAAYTAINAWTFSAYAFPTYLLILNLIITFTVKRGKASK